jgi:hypothetical protein
MIVGTLLAVAGASAVGAAEGVPSQRKLDKLGLAGMSIVTDEVGMQVRGQGDFVKVVFNWQTAAGEKATFINGQYTPANPPRLFLNDSNRGSAIATDGGGIGGGAAQPQAIAFQSTARHQQDVLAPPFFASELSAARSAATIIAGNAKALGIKSVSPF